MNDTTTAELGKVELDYLQRVAIARLQGMDIGVSFGLLKGMILLLYYITLIMICSCLIGRSGKLGKLSTSMRRKISNDRPCECH